MSDVAKMIQIKTQEYESFKTPTAPNPTAKAVMQDYF